MKSEYAKIPNLLLIAGTGTKSGKTTMACRIIEEFGNMKITAVKITPHFHETTPGLVLLAESNGYSVYEETETDSPKDTSRMLRSGAEKVYYAKVWDDRLFEAFKKIMEHIPGHTPVICESPALRYSVEPGIFVIMTSDNVVKYKDINNLQDLPHVMIKLEELNNLDVLTFRFENGRWFYRK
jgi:hypothetical protein